MVDKELETTKQQQNNIRLEVEQAVVEGEKLQHLYQKRDELLGETLLLLVIGLTCNWAFHPKMPYSRDNMQVTWKTNWRKS